MAQMTRKRTAWLVILGIIAAGMGMYAWKGEKTHVKFASPLFKSAEILGGPEAKEYSQRFVAGDRGAEEKIVIVNIHGEITNSRWGPSYRRGMVDEIIGQLKQAGKDEKTRAIILSINSPGGPVIDADILYMKLKEVGKKKIIVALLDRVAASGGYYVALAAHKIVAHPLTLTGSIGVIMDFANLQGLLEDKLGIEMNVIKSGRYKDIGSPYRPMSRNEREMLQDLVNTAHRRFVEIVADGRKISRRKAAFLADGRIYSGEQAKEAGLVDELGMQDKAIELAKELCGIKKAKVVEFYSRARLRDILFNKFSDSFKIKEIPSLPEPALKYIWRPSLQR